MKPQNKDSRDLATRQALQELKSVSEALRSAKSTRDVLNFTIKKMLKFNFDRVRIWLIDLEKGIKFGAKCSYITDEKFNKVIVSIKKQDDENLPLDYLKIIERKRPFVNRTFPVLKKFFGEKKMKYSVEFPLFAGKVPMGLLSVDNTLSGRSISVKAAENKISPIVNHIALVLNRVIAEEKIREANRNLEKKIVEATAELKTQNAELAHLANFDDLSGLPNRRHFERRFEEEFKKAGKQKTLSLAMVDIDFLKHLNDTRGHSAGDQLIRKIGEILKNDKHIDFAARFAGDEFIFLLVQKSANERKQILQKIISKIKKATGQSISVGCVSTNNSKVKSTIDMVRFADDALYHAKHTGRNRFVCFDEKGEEISSFAERKLNLQKIEKQGTSAVDYIRQLDAINKISEHLRKSSSEKIALRKITTSIQKTLNFIRVGVYLKTEDGKLELAAYSSRKDVLLAKIIKNPEKIQPLYEKLIETIQKRKVLNSDASRYWSEFVFVKNFGIEKALFIPLIGRRHVIGVIIAQYDSNNFFRENDFDFFLTLGAQIENGIVKARVVAEIENFNRKLKKEVVAATTQLRKYSSSLEEQIRDNCELREQEQRTHFELISSLVTSIEEKDIYTRGHSVRVASYAVKLGRELGMNKNKLTDLRYAGLLHDVGKVAVDQSILQKRTALTEAEARELENHPLVGEKIVSSVRFLKSAAIAIRQHHERWGGGGYPDGLRGRQILLEARILSIADAYDAMITRRSYGRKMSRAEAIRELEAGGGKQFDPQLVKIFVKMLQSGRVRKPQSKFSKF